MGNGSSGYRSVDCNTTYVVLVAWHSQPCPTHGRLAIGSLLHRAAPCACPLIRWRTGRSDLKRHLILSSYSGIKRINVPPIAPRTSLREAGANEKPTRRRKNGLPTGYARKFSRPSASPAPEHAAFLSLRLSHSQLPFPLSCHRNETRARNLHREHLPPSPARCTGIKPASFPFFVSFFFGPSTCSFLVAVLRTCLRCVGRVFPFAFNIHSRSCLSFTLTSHLSFPFRAVPSFPLRTRPSPLPSPRDLTRHRPWI